MWLPEIKKSDLAICLQKGGETGGIAGPQIRNVILTNTGNKNQEIQLGPMAPERWPNWRVGVKGPPRPGEIFKNVSRWQNLKVLDDSPQFR